MIVSRNGITEELRAFIHSKIDSVQEVEILALLVEGGERTWSMAALSEALYAESDGLHARIHALIASGLAVEVGDGIRYQCAEPDQVRLVRELLDAYKVRRAAVITAIFSR